MPRRTHSNRKAQGHKTKPRDKNSIAYVKPNQRKTSAPIEVGQTIEDWKASLRWS